MRFHQAALITFGLALLSAAPGRSEIFVQQPMRPPGSIPQAKQQLGPQAGHQPGLRHDRNADVTGSIATSSGIAASSNAPFSTMPPATMASRDMSLRESSSAEGVTSPAFRRQVVEYAGPEMPGTIVVDTDHTFLYFVLPHGQAIRYGVGVGRDGFRWAGQQAITRVAQWPDWHPPSEMIERQPYLPRFMAGGPSNPLGARALYLGNSVYRIHGTNDPKTIGQFISSGCIRLINEDIEDLYSRVTVGTPVIVLPSARGVMS